MRIAVATTRPFHLFHLARELAAIGHTVDLYSYIPAAYASRYRHGLARHTSLFIRELPWTVFALTRLSTALQTRATQTLLTRMDRRYEELNLEQYDVVIGLSGTTNRLCHKAKGTSTLTVCDRGSSHVATQVKATHGMVAQFDSSYVKRELDHYAAADFVVVPSLFAFNSFVEHGFPSTRLLRNPYGVDLARFRHPPRRASGTSRKIIFVGQWSFRKGADLLSKALDASPNVRLTHAGTRGDVPFPDSRRFVSLGAVPNARLPQVLREHDLLVLPSREDGFGLVLLEAIAAGLPVIASRTSGGPDIKEVVQGARDGIEILDELSPTCLSHALSENRLELCSGEQSNVIDYFSWSAYGRRYDDLLQRLRSI